MKIKILSVLLSIFIIFASFPVTVFSEVKNESAALKQSSSVKLEGLNEFMRVTINGVRRILGLPPDATPKRPIIGTDVDVKYNFGAKGDGVHDDTAAIQNSLDHLRLRGGTIYFPCGTYMISSCIIFYSNQKLVFSEGAIIRRTADIGTSEKSKLRYLMASYTQPGFSGYTGTHNTVISGATFDGNCDIGSRITLLNLCHCSGITIENCSFVNTATWHCLECNSSSNVTVKNSFFDGQSYTDTSNGVNNELVQLDGARDKLYGSIYYSNGTEMKFKKDDTPCNIVDIIGCTFVCNGFSAIGNHVDFPHHGINIHNNSFFGDSGDMGFIKFAVSTYGISISENEFYAQYGNKKYNCVGVHIDNIDVSNCKITNNVFFGNFERYFYGNATASNNVFK